MNPGASLGWLHLTDLHQGLHPQRWLWPGVREKLHDDLERLHTQSGPWDLVLFTGDLTQRGSPEEFQALDETLEGLWRLFRRLGSSPVLLAVPGNHDLVRPDASEVLPELQAWEGWPSVQERFWETSTGRLRELIDEAFHPFTEWLADWYARHPLPPSVSLRQGLLPGDFSTSLLLQDIRLGVVGLNSAFLQLMDGDFKGRLDLDVRQLHGACAGDAMAWVRRNHFTFLLTHHPVDWLHPRSQSHFRAEIDEPGRFAAHFFGHMHSAGAAAERLLGFEQQCRLQGASLFGLETFGEQQTRIHGYSAGRLALTSPQAASLRVWPRLLVPSSAGFRHIIPDPNFRLEKEAFTHSLPVRAVSTDERLTAADEDALHARELTERLSRARARYKVLMKGGVNAEVVERARQEVVQLQRDLRQGRPLQPGDLLSARYELLERVGAGGFATVWKAFDDKEERLVAVKVLHRDVAEDTSKRERFFRGAEAMARLRHPHILQVFEVRGEDGPYPYSVLEYAPEGDLRSAVKDKRLSWARFFEAILAVGDALEEAHRNGLIHRDVKPANILLKGGKALLGDFDLVRVTDSAVITRTGVMGTFLYAAPEVLESGKKADARSDVFSLGMTVLHGLYGADLPLDAFRASGEFIERFDCEESLKRTLRQAVRWERHERYASVAEFCDALEQSLGTTAPTTKHEPFPEEETQPPKRLRQPEPQPPERLKRFERRTLVIWGGLLVSVAALATGAAIVGLRRPPPAVQFLLKATPSTARLRVNDKILGFTPVRLDATPGQELVIQAEAPNHKTITRTVHVGEGPQQVEYLELEPLSVPAPSANGTPDTPEVPPASAETRESTPASAPQPVEMGRGTVHFEVTPWADVSCGGRNLGTTPLPDVSLAAGVYECRFVNPEWGPRTRQVEVKPNSHTRVVVKF